MDEREFELEIAKLVKEFGELVAVGLTQSRKLSQKNENSQDPHLKLEGKESSLEDSLAYLRVCIKYLLFDLGATQRENEYLRKLIKEKQ